MHIMHQLQGHGGLQKIMEAAANRINGDIGFGGLGGFGGGLGGGMGGGMGAFGAAVLLAPWALGDLAIRYCSSSSRWRCSAVAAAMLGGGGGGGIDA
mmetsp:Transcript_20648/g.42103  ORF Transcript_20648/g.42103 Transcript_20648/m.42103 type:complete len:97 (+) Transcript_20648:499-789(+)